MTVECPTTPAWRSSAAAIGVLLIVAALGIAWLMRWGPDWPAQEFRAWSAAHDGLTLWTNRWYSGTALAGYSLIYPPLGAVVGAPAVGVLAVVLAWCAAVGLAPQVHRAHRAAFLASVAFVLSCALLIGQVPFLLGVAFGVWAVRAATCARSWWTAAAALACSAGSPLAGALLLIAAIGLGAALGPRRVAPLRSAAIGVGVAPLLGGAGGPFPFLTKTLVWIIVFGVALILLTRSGSARRFAWVYAGAGVICFLVANPVGANIARLGQLTALPLLCLLHHRSRIRTTAPTVVLALLAGLWPAWPAVSAALRGADDPSQHRVFYTGLLDYLHRSGTQGGRLEVVFTREHWESLYVAQALPIARGWERQTDLAANAPLYHPLDGTTYRRWLDDNAVSLVALPRAPIDYGGRAEATLLRHPPSYLAPVWHDRDWQVWRVRQPQPLVTGRAQAESIGPASVRLRFRTAGTATVRIRASPLWILVAGHGCVGKSSTGWLTVTATEPGSISLLIGLDWPPRRSGADCVA